MNKINFVIKAELVGDKLNYFIELDISQDFDYLVIKKFFTAKLMIYANEYSDCKLVNGKSINDIL